MDIQALKESLEVALEFFEINEKLLKKGEEIARAICELTLYYVNEGINIKDIYFDYSEIHKEVWGKEVDTSKASAAVRKHMEVTNEFFSATSPLNIKLKELNKSPLILIVDASAGGRKTQISLSITQNSQSRYNVKSEQERIIYSAVQLPKVYAFTKPFVDMELKLSQVILIFVSTLILSIIAILSLLDVIEWGDVVFEVIVITVFFPSAYLLLKLKEILDKGITDLPVLMAPIRTRNAMLVLNKKRQNDKTSLKMKAVTFEAQCAICGEDIIIEKSREFRGRYIGKCAVAPTEHIYSFDHVTKTGKFLR
ncbi:hypothetical protein [uncultured Alteromonas sp.]|uniref:hypothetical protein n=1 Tax=uncultured Alteromonas sp. TaxID=179113 RepID=UPI0030DC8DCB